MGLESEKYLTIQELTPEQALEVDMQGGTLLIKGDKGEKGDTWKPTVSEDGELSWEINQEDEAPTPINIKGPQGIQGEKGEQGLPFSIKKIYSSVEEMEADFDSENVSMGDFVIINTNNVEDEDNAKLFKKGKEQYELIVDMSGARGKQGAQGQQGLQGLQGEQGKQGVQGLRGEKGEPGEKGEQGLRGETGAIGPQGVKGDNGKEIELQKSSSHVQWKYQGEEEWKNLISLSELKGEKGEQGETGAPGPQGIQGLRGEQGIKGQDGKNGLDGAQGPRGLQGETGARGPQGLQGERGLPFAIKKIYRSVSEMNQDFSGDEVSLNEFVLVNTGNTEDEDNAKLFIKSRDRYEFIVDMSGARGIQGPQGIQGLQGEKGQQGEIGPQGLQGIQGPQGPQGKQGFIGPQGPPGKSVDINTIKKSFINVPLGDDLTYNADLQGKTGTMITTATTVNLPDEAQGMAKYGVLFFLSRVDGTQFDGKYGVQLYTTNEAPILGNIFIRYKTNGVWSKEWKRLATIEDTKQFYDKQQINEKIENLQTKLPNSEILETINNKIIVLTQQEYDELLLKDENTLYFIKEVQ